MRTLSITAIVCLAISILSSPLQAEIAPGTYDELKKKAPEVFQIRVVDVRENRKGTPDIRTFVCRATVLQVHRSELKHKVGATISFVTYYVAPTVERGPRWGGPKSPPLVQQGWTGKIYLTPSTSASDKKLAPLTLAAYGKSFESKDDKKEERRENLRRVIGGLFGRR